jgi:hypothetical protein
VAFSGAAVVARAGWTFAASGLAGPTTAGVLLSSTDGLGEAMTCRGCGTSFDGAAAAGSVSPPAATHAW